MRKILLSMLALAGLALLSAVPASANAAGAVVHKPAALSESDVTKAGYRHHRRHGGFSIGFGYGYPRYRYWGYPRYAYYDDYYYRPRYYHRPRYYGHRHWRHRHRHHRHHW